MIFFFFYLGTLRQFVLLLCMKSAIQIQLEMQTSDFEESNKNLSKNILSLIIIKAGEV